MVEKIKVFYVTCLVLPVGPNSGVIRTQVYELLKRISTICPDSIYIRWLCFVVKEHYEANILELKKLNSDFSNLKMDLKIVTFHNHFRLFVFLRIMFFLLKEHLKFLPDIIHFRSFQPALFTLIIKFIFGHRVKIISDPRGVYPEEQRQIRSWRRNSFNYRMLKIIESWSLRKSDVTICMSKQLEEHYRSIWDRGIYLFNPPCVDFQRFNLNSEVKITVRNKYQLPLDSHILLYSGSFDWPWSVSYLCGEIFQKINKRYPETYLMVLSNSEEEKIKDFFLKSGIEEKALIVISPEYKDIPKLYNAADIGIIVREESIINKVAFPIKFLEYLASGLPVLVTKANFSICQMVKNENIGLIYKSEDNDFLKKLEKLLDRETKLRCKNFSKNHDITEISKKYIDIYFKFLGYQR